MKPILSVIIPVYNIKNYLEECLNSVINQTLKEIEIILVEVVLILDELYNGLYRFKYLLLILDLAVLAGDYQGLLSAVELPVLNSIKDKGCLSALKKACYKKYR